MKLVGDAESNGPVLELGRFFGGEANWREGTGDDGCRDEGGFWRG